MKQTVVEWLRDRYYQMDGELSEEDFEQAEEIEKEHIIYAHVAGHNAPSSTIKNLDAEQYYNETFKQQEQ
jgi:hypothetical protein